MKLKKDKDSDRTDDISEARCFHSEARCFHCGKFLLYDENGFAFCRSCDRGDDLDE